MKPFLGTLLMCLFLNSPVANCQPAKLDKKQFFIDQTPINVSIEAYWSKLISKKSRIGETFSARFTGKLSDTAIVDEPVVLTVRGHFRREFCNMPPLKILFTKTATSIMYPLKSIKIVNACNTSDAHEQFLFKEYLTYKIYNLLTDKSFRVRLLNVNYKDSNESKKSQMQHAFFTEDLSDMAKRNKCKEFETRLNDEVTNRKQMTLVALFEYMIGNTDWSVAGAHNIKLIQPIDDPNARPLAVAYDFDFSGLVNTGYGAHDPLLNAPSESVEERIYRGFPRSIEELNEALEIFKKQKENIYSLINNFSLLTEKSKKSMISYLEQFYVQINNQEDVRKIFINGARAE